MTVALDETHVDILFQNSLGLTFLLDSQGKILNANQATLNLLEMTSDEVIGLTFDKMNANYNSASILKEVIETVRYSKKLVRLESQFLIKNQTKVISLTVSPVLDSRGVVAYIVCEGNDVTQEKIQEQQLVADQIFKNTILDYTSDGIMVFDTAGNITFANTTAREIFGIQNHPEITVVEVIQNSIDFFQDKESKQLSWDEIPYGLALKDIEVSDFELSIALKDQLPAENAFLEQSFKARNLSISSRLINDDDGHLKSIVISYEDISDKKQAMLSEGVLEERFSHAFENAVIGIVILSSRGVIIDANRALCTILGYEQSGLIGKTIADITHPDDVTLTDMLFDEIESGMSNSIYYEKKLRHKSGLSVDAIVGISVSRDEQDQINYVIAHILDVTENNKITKALALSQKNYQSIFNSQLDAVVVTNLSGKILNLNPSAIKLFGFSIEEIDGLMFWELFAVQESQQIVFEELYKQDQDKIHTDRIRYLHKNGDAFPAETVGYLIYDSDGQRLGYTWIIQDVSEKKIAEITLARINQRLAVSREEERRSLARELHDGIVQDLVGFSYELAGLESQFIVEDDFSVDTHDLRDMRGKLTRSIKQLRSFISDLRPVGLEEFGFQSALESYVALLERDRKNVNCFPSIALEIDDVGELSIPVNLCLFRSVQEGLTNILKHSKAKNVIIALTFKKSSKDTLVLTIKDDGIGFKVPKDINDFSNKQHFGLIGIKERVTLIDGHFLVKSQMNKGTTLTLTLPYERES